MRWPAGEAARAGWCGCAILVLLACSGPQPVYVPHDAALRNASLSFYPVRDAARPRAMLFFFGNDVGFWTPHQELASYLAGHGYSVVGLDMKPLLASLPDAEPARDSVFRTRIGELLSGARHELAADSVPLVVGGHSLGAEVALWTAANVRLPRLQGVLAMAPGGRSHLRVSWLDLANAGDPTGPESFSVPEQVTRLPGDARLAVIRGDHDKYGYADPAILAAGGSRVRRYMVPFASHSLKRILIAKVVVLDALGWITAAPPAHHQPH